MIFKIKKIIEQEERMSLHDLSLRFRMDEDAIEKMLEVLVVKGRLSRKDLNSSKKHCGGCNVHCHNRTKYIFYEKE